MEALSNGTHHSMSSLPPPLRRIRSVNVVAGPHSSPADPHSNDTLTTVYHALLVSALTSWPIQPALTVDAFVKFVRLMFERLPSSSSTASSSPNAVPFSQLLVDVVWSVDAELEDIISDAKSALAEEQKGADSSKSFDRDAVAKGLHTKQSAEEDKETLVGVVRRLLVRVNLSSMLYSVDGVRVVVGYSRPGCMQRASRSQPRCECWIGPRQTCLREEGDPYKDGTLVCYIFYS